MSEMYKQFNTDKDLETQGVVIDYSGDFRVRVARAGGSNRKYLRVLEAKSKPLRRAIQNDLVSREKLRDMVRDVFAETCVLNWEVNTGTVDEPVWTQGIESEDGSIIEFTKENVIATFRNLPDLCEDLQEQANKASLYRAEQLEKEAKN